MPSSGAASTLRIWATSAWRWRPQKALQLDTVLFAPVGIQPLKPTGSTASFEDRVAMTELAIDGWPQFAISFADAPDPGGTPNYTIDTLARLREEFPAATLFTLMGADSLVGLRRWHRGAELAFRSSTDRCVATGPAA